MNKLDINASLITIGTVTYGDSDYNLIWDDNNNGKSLVWLDYSKDPDQWINQKTWVAGLDSALTYHIDPAYTISWIDENWRLPSAGKNPEIGYYQTSSEMGHLYYEELGNLGYRAASGDLQDDYGLKNTGDFVNLKEKYYWTLTENIEGIFFFHMEYGLQAANHEPNNRYGLGVRNATVTDATAPPSPLSI